MADIWPRLFAYGIAVGIGIAIGKLTYISNTERDDIRLPPSDSRALIHNNACVNDATGWLD